MTTPFLSTQNLAKSYRGQAVLEKLELQIEAQQRYSIQGPSGCGKSTLLRLLAGLESPDAGTIQLEGQVASTAGKILLPPWRRKTQMVFQDLGLWPTRTVLQHVVDMRKAGQLPNPKAEGQKILAQLGLDGLEKRRPAHLSGGEARRLAFARVMAMEPKLILLDEAFSSLDAENREQGFQLLEQVIANTQAAVLLVTHDPLEAERLGGTCLHMQNGGLHCA